MNKLKHIKLFEGFESVKLSKTLGYMDSGRDKEVFLNYIKKLCNKLDFPYSKLSDDYFDYLPFSAALKKADILTDEPCDATSGNAFPRYEVPGETCNKGKIKRKWGRQIRNVSCPICNGTGVKPKKGEPKLVKFWFTKDGQYVDATCVDGLIRKRRSSYSNEAKIGISQERKDYTHVRVPGINQSDDDWRTKLREIQSGQYVYITINSRSMYALILRSGGETWAIQPYQNGDYPYRDTIDGFRWRDYARRSWALQGGDFQEIKFVNLKTKVDETEEEADPYTWNTSIRFNYAGIRAGGNDIENNIKRAHFAIILDFSKLKDSEYKKMSTSKEEREESREGALALRNDEDIKRENIERYIEELSKRMEIGGDISNVGKIIKRILGQNPAYVIRSGLFKSGLSNIMSSYMNLMRANEGDKEYYAKELDRTVKHIYKDSAQRNKTYTKNVEEIKKKLASEEKDVESKILGLLHQYGDIIKERIINTKIETIEDLEVLYQRSLGMKNILTSSRYYTNKLNSYMDYMSRRDIGYSYRYLTDDYYIRNHKDEVINGLEMAIRMAKKM